MNKGKVRVGIVVCQGKLGGKRGDAAGMAVVE